MASNKSQPLSVTRERRTNAGSKMAQMIDAEEEDFYKTTYGGFVEEVDDNDYVSEGSDSGDEVDSDFDIDENDELISEDEDEDKSKSKRKSVYKEPATKKPRPPTTTTQAQKPKPKSGRQQQQTSSPIKSAQTIKKSFRESTKRAAAETEARVKLAKEESEARKKLNNSLNNNNKWRQLTQAEMLREAKKTEQVNLKSLERYRKMELEKSKKNKIVKEGIRGPIIRYQSVTMPMIQEINQQDQNDKNDQDDQNDQNDKNTDDDGQQLKDKKTIDDSKKCSRTFISFSDEETFKKYFPHRKPPIVKPKLFCPISHLPGRYFDPVTQLPFANSNTFRAMREAYYKQLEILGDVKQPEVAKWINWRKRNTRQIQPRIIQIIK